MKRVVFIGVSIILILAVATGVYLYQQQRINRLEADNELLSRELASAAASDNAAKSDDTSTNAKPSDPAKFTSQKGVTVSLTYPARDQVVTSPLNVSGQVPGSWSSEAQFTIRLTDSSGNVLAEAPALLQDDWMTEQPVAFKSRLTFTKPATDKGSLVLVKANPSGHPAQDDSVIVPVKF